MVVTCLNPFKPHHFGIQMKSRLNADTLEEELLKSVNFKIVDCKEGEIGFKYRKASVSTQLMLKPQQQL